MYTLYADRRNDPASTERPGRARFRTAGLRAGPRNLDRTAAPRRGGGSSSSRAGAAPREELEEASRAPSSKASSSASSYRALGVGLGAVEGVRVVGVDRRRASTVARRRRFSPHRRADAASSPSSGGGAGARRRGAWRAPRRTRRASAARRGRGRGRGRTARRGRAGRARTARSRRSARARIRGAAAPARAATRADARGGAREREGGRDRPHGGRQRSRGRATNRSRACVWRESAATPSPGVYPPLERRPRVCCSGARGGRSVRRPGVAGLLNRRFVRPRLIRSRCDGREISRNRPLRTQPRIAIDDSDGRMGWIEIWVAIQVKAGYFARALDRRLASHGSRSRGAGDQGTPVALMSVRTRASTGASRERRRGLRAGAFRRSRTPRRPPPPHPALPPPPTRATSR